MLPARSGESSGERERERIRAQVHHTDSRCSLAGPRAVALYAPARRGRAAGSICDREEAHPHTARLGFARAPGSRHPQAKQVAPSRARRRDHTGARASPAPPTLRHAAR